MQKGKIMDIELCKKCIHAKDAAAHTNTVCELCYQIDDIGHGANYHFIEKISKPDTCGQCVHCQLPKYNMYSVNRPYCDASGTLNTDDRYIMMEYIRKNYLSKGTPKWCPMRK